MVHISRCKPINKEEQTEKIVQTDENLPGISQTMHTNQTRNVKPVVQIQEPTSRYPLRSRGVNVNTIMMLTLICLVNTFDCTTTYTKEYLHKTLVPISQPNPKQPSSIMWEEKHCC